MGNEPGELKRPSLTNQLEHGIAARYWHEGVPRGAGRDRKVALDSAPKSAQIGFKYFRFFLIGNRAELKVQAHSPLLERHPLRRLRIARPLRIAARRDQEELMVVIQDIHRRRVDLAGFASSNLEQIVAFETEPKADESAEEAINEPLNGIKL